MDLFKKEIRVGKQITTVFRTTGLHLNIPELFVFVRPFHFLNKKLITCTSKRRRHSCNRLLAQRQQLANGLIEYHSNYPSIDRIDCDCVIAV